MRVIKQLKTSGNTIRLTGLALGVSCFFLSKQNQFLFKTTFFFSTIMGEYRLFYLRKNAIFNFNKRVLQSQIVYNPKIQLK